MRSGSAILTAVWLLLAVVYPVPVMIEAPEETRALAVYVTRAAFLGSIIVVAAIAGWRRFRAIFSIFG
jgi:hypothetical protein